ncbi:MAG TPA: MAPEG family protein [Burkholderiales bacterium]|nr:MAPEG family protein [Burkholderiales bacterium]
MVVTPLYAAILAAVFLLLTLRVVQLRRSAGVSLGDGGNTALQRAIRAHANFAEYVPFALIMLLILEMSRFSLYLIHLLGILLVVARLLHGYALAYTAQFRFGRFAGATLTVAVLIIEALLCVYQAYRGHVVWFTT